jgi:predicted DNA-binding protein (MmcQ/YjbR family)
MSDDELETYIAQSYRLVRDGLPRRVRESLQGTV